MMNECYSLTFLDKGIILIGGKEVEVMRVTKEPEVRRQEILDTALK